MPYETTWEPNGICQKFWGIVESPELFDSLTDVHRDPRFKSLRYVIKDYLDVEVFDVGVKTIVDGLAFNAAAKHRNPHIVVAVVTTDPRIIESSRAALSYRLDAYPRKIFATLAEARAWVNERGTVAVKH